MSEVTQGQCQGRQMNSISDLNLTSFRQIYPPNQLEAAFYI